MPLRHGFFAFVLFFASGRSVTLITQKFPTDAHLEWVGKNFAVTVVTVAINVFIYTAPLHILEFGLSNAIVNPCESFGDGIPTGVRLFPLNFLVLRKIML